MKIYVILVFFLLVVVPAAFADSKDIFVLKDAHGDDHGDGTLIFPTTGELHYGDLDIISVSAKADEGGTMFKVEFANSIDLPDSRSIDAGGQTLDKVARLGFYKFNVDIYIDTDRKTGSGLTNTLPGRNALIDPEFAWEHVICLTPRPNETKNLLKRQLVDLLEEKLKDQKGRVDPEDTSKISADASMDLEGTYYFPERIRVSGRTISFFVPSSSLGGTASADWGYVVVVTAATVEDRLSVGGYGGAQVGRTLMNLPVVGGSWSDRLGSSRKEAKLLPPIIDILVPEGKKQEDVLRDFNTNTNQLVVLPGIIPSQKAKQ